MGVVKVSPIITATLAMSCLGASALGGGCRSPAPTEHPGPDIHLSDVEAYRHTGEDLTASAKAESATLTPDGAAARLEDGAVTMEGPDVTVAAPTVDIDLSESRASGRDGVSVDGPGYEMEGDELEIDGDEATLKVAGRVTAKEARSTEVEEASGDFDMGDEEDEIPSSTPADDDASRSAPKPITIDADEVVLHRRTNQAIFTGNVVVVRGDMRLTSRSLTVTYAENQRVSHILAEDDVRVTEEDRVITANKAEFDNVEEVLTLTGDAVLTEGDNVIRGERVVFTLGAEEIRVERVRARVRVEDAADE